MQYAVVMKLLEWRLTCGPGCLTHDETTMGGDAIDEIEGAGEEGGT